MTIRCTDALPQPRRLFSAVALLGGLGVLSWVAGCSVVADADRAQCSTTADCTSRGPAFAGTVCSAGLCGDDPAHPPCSKDADCAAISDAICSAGLCQVDTQWGCRNAPTVPHPGYKLTMHVKDAVTAKPLGGVTAQLCKKLDVLCSDPFGPKIVSDDAGLVAMTVDPAFEGYVLMNDPRIAPALYFLTAPASGDLDLPTVPLATPLAAAGIVRNAGGPSSSWMQDRGIMLLNVFDCQTQPAANITFSVGGALDPAMFVFYLKNGLPTKESSATDTTGYGGLVNVPEGVASITATLGPAPGQKISASTFLVRPGHVTYARMMPNNR